MKLVALFVFLFLKLGSAQPTVVASTIAQCLGSNTAITTGTACGGSSNAGAAIDTTGASLLVMWRMVFSAGTIGACSDSKGNTWTDLAQYSSGSFYIKSCYAIPSTSATIGSGHTFSVAASGSGSFNSVAVAAFVGTQSTTALRGSTDTGAANGTNISITPVATHDVLLTGLSDDSTNAKANNGGFTILQNTTATGNGETGAIGWLDAPNTSTVTFTWTNANSGSINGVAFQVGAAPSSGSTAITRRFMGMGR